MNSLFTRFAVIIAFLAVGFGADAQSISSNLNARPNVHTGVQEDFVVALNAGPLIGTQVKLRITLTDPAQAANINLSLQDPLGSTYSPLFFTGGVSESAAAPFFTVNLNARATFNATGTYGYNISVINAANNSVIAGSDEFVVVSAVQQTAPAISSNLDGQSLLVGDRVTFTVNTVANDYAGTLVKVLFEMDPAQVADTHVEYFETANSTWTSFVIDANGRAVFGPGTGFPLADISTLFRVTYDAAGTYGYKLSLFEAAAPNDTLAVSEGSVEVEDLPAPQVAVYSDLDGRGGVVTNVLQNVTVTTEAENVSGVDVRIRYTLDDPAQASNVELRFQNPATGSQELLTFDASGTAYAGDANGFPLADYSYTFSILFGGSGTYGYEIALLDVADQSVVASQDEEVYVSDHFGIKEQASVILSAFPNPTTDHIQIQTGENGTGTLGVYTPAGQKVAAQNINGTLHNVSLETLPAGTYMIKITQNGRTSVVRAVKQ